MAACACARVGDPPTREVTPCSAICYTRSGRLRADIYGCTACLPPAEQKPEPAAEPDAAAASAAAAEPAAAADPAAAAEPDAAAELDVAEDQITEELAAPTEEKARQKDHTAGRDYYTTDVLKLLVAIISAVAAYLQLRSDRQRNREERILIHDVLHTVRAVSANGREVSVAALKLHEKTNQRAQQPQAVFNEQQRLGGVHRLASGRRERMLPTPFRSQSCTFDNE